MKRGRLREVQLSRGWGLSAGAGLFDPGEVRLAVVFAPDGDHSQGRVESFLSTLEEAVFEPPGLILGVSDDQDFLGRVLAQRVLRRGQGVAISNFAHRRDPGSTQLGQGNLQAPFRLGGSAVDVSQRMAEGRLLHCRGDHHHIARFRAPQVPAKIIDHIAPAQLIRDDHQDAGGRTPGVGNSLHLVANTPMTMGETRAAQRRVGRRPTSS